MSDDCVFCRIVRGELPATVRHRADGFVAIDDIAPKADVHILVLPELHLEAFRDVPRLEAATAKRMLDFIAATAVQAGLQDYRVMTFCGAAAGQTVFHLHWHVLGGTFRGMPV